MKKTYLVFVATIMAFVVSEAQTTVWNFSNAPFGANPTISFATTFTLTDGLTVGTDGTVLWTGLSANSKTIDGVSYTIRMQTGGGGAPLLPSKIPTTRYLSFNVSGPMTIKVGVISSSSGASRTLIIVNSDESVIDSITNIVGSAAATYTYEYTGAASKIYLYSRASGLNYYYLSATKVVPTGIQKTFASKGITFNGTEIINTNNEPLELFSALGKRLKISNNNISVAGLQKGIYIVRIAGSNYSMKICM